MRQSPTQRLESRISIPDEKGCQLFTGRTDKDGYGRITWYSKNRIAHRIIFQEHWGVMLPRRLCVLHTCDNRLCCNLDHLWLGTVSDNNRDRHLKGRSAKGKQSGRYTKPERTSRGENHYFHLHSELMPKIKPEQRARGEQSGARKHPERLVRGEGHHSAKLTEVQALEAMTMFNQGISLSVISRKFNISWTSAKKIVSGRSWRHLFEELSKCP